jgi:hypothetical protein
MKDKLVTPKFIKEIRKRTLLDEIQYYCYYAPLNYLDMLPRRIYWFFQRGFRGYADNDTWDFDLYLAKIITGGLKQLKKYHHGCPSDIYAKYKDRKDLTQHQKDRLAVKEWKTNMDIMIRGFEIVPKLFDMKVLKNKTMKEGYFYEFERGLDVFKKYYFNLWD